MNPNQQITGAELQTLREACGLGRDELGEMMGVQARTIKHWENGRAGVPGDVGAYLVRLDEAINEQMQAQREALQASQRTQGGRLPAQLVLIRYRTNEPPASSPEQGRCAYQLNTLPEGVSGAVLGRLRLELRQSPGWERVPVRVVWFDPAGFEAWRQANNQQATETARQQWAAQELALQAIPHRADQPLA